MNGFLQRMAQRVAPATATQSPGVGRVRPRLGSRFEPGRETTFPSSLESSAAPSEVDAAPIAPTVALPSPGAPSTSTPEPDLRPLPALGDPGAAPSTDRRGTDPPRALESRPAAPLEGSAPARPLETASPRPSGQGPSPVASPSPASRGRHQDDLATPMRSESTGRRSPRIGPRRPSASESEPRNEVGTPAPRRPADPEGTPRASAEPPRVSRRDRRPEEPIAPTTRDATSPRPKAWPQDSQSLRAHEAGIEPRNDGRRESRSESPGPTARPSRRDREPSGTAERSTVEPTEASRRPIGPTESSAATTLEHNARRGAEAALAPRVEIRIGRIEVRAPTPPQQPMASPPRRRTMPQLSLDGYLDRRRRGGRR